MIPRLQWERALALAEVHGHDWAAWAEGWTLDEPSEDQIRDLAAAGRLTLSALTRGVPVEVAPVPIPSSWDEARARYLTWVRADDIRSRLPGGLSPDHEHVTGTGRLAWHVDEDGATEVWVRRPCACVVHHRDVHGPWGAPVCTCGQPEGRTVLHAIVTPAGEVAVDRLGPYLDRHVEALRFALVALVGEDLARERAAYLQDGIGEDLDWYLDEPQPSSEDELWALQDAMEVVP